MSMWLRRLLVGIVAVLTLGTVVPTGYLHINNKTAREDVQETQSENQLYNQPVLKTRPEESKNRSGESDQKALQLSRGELQSRLVSMAVKEATNQGKQKFGLSIQKKIGDKYEHLIVPKFGDAVYAMSDQLSDDQIKQISISQHPSSGQGERIIHLYDQNTKKSYLKLHVRRDHPPLEGYWFNFHYHTYKDEFTGHHDLAKVYWNKNTPPNWQA